MLKNSTRELISKYQSKTFYKSDALYKASEIAASQLIAEKKSNLGDVPYLTARNSVIFFDSKILIHQDKIDNSDKIPPLRFEDDIETFSKKSRLRMLKLLSTINYSNYNSIFFVTTTFHNIAPESKKNLKIFLDTYLKRVKRLDESLSYVWRLELQKRGMPHFHFLFLSKKKYEKTSLKKIEHQFKRKWHTLLSDLNLYSYLHSVKVDLIDEKKRVLSYISKYTAKEDKAHDAFKYGRRWSYSNNIDCTPHSVKVFDDDLIKLLREKLLAHIKKFSNISAEFESLIKSNYSVEIIIPFEEQKMLIKECLKELIDKAPS